MVKDLGEAVLSEFKIEKQDLCNFVFDFSFALKEGKNVSEVISEYFEKSKEDETLKELLEYFSTVALLSFSSLAFDIDIEVLLSKEKEEEDVRNNQCRH